MMKREEGKVAGVEKERERGEVCACICKCVIEVGQDYDRQNWGVAGVQCPMIDRSLAVCSNPTVSISFILIYI